MRKNTMLTRVSVACAALAVAGVAVACSSGDDTQIGKAADAKIGECLTISGGGGKEEKVDVDKASCDSGDKLTFYAASVIAEDAKCVNENYSVLTFEDKSRLCITPNFVKDQCYQIPMSSGILADYQKVACDATPKEGSAIFKTTERSEATPTCDGTQLAVGYETPIKVGYCLLKQDQA